MNPPPAPGAPSHNQAPEAETLRSPGQFSAEPPPGRPEPSPGRSEPEQPSPTDALADVPAVRRLVGRSPDVWDEDEWLEWEELDYVAEGAYARVTGRAADDFYAAMESLGGDDDELADPAGARWDAREDAESHRRLPRLSALFPLPAAS